MNLILPESEIKIAIQQYLERNGFVVKSIHLPNTSSALCDVRHENSDTKVLNETDSPMDMNQI